MEVLWQQSPLTSKQIIEQLSIPNDWQEKTIKTLLNRLLKKQAISYRKIGRAYLYSPELSQSDYQQDESKRFLNQFFSGKLSTFVATFVKQEALNKKDIEQLKQILKELDSDQ